MTDTTKARAVADALRPIWPEKAAEIDRLVAECEAGKRDRVNVSVGIRYRLEKFDGEIVPGKQPCEVIEGHDRIQEAMPCP